MSKEILITGGTGMMGRHIDWRLEKNNISVDLSTSIEKEVSKKDGIYFADYTDPESIHRLANGGYKVIFNMAGIADPKVCRKKPDLADQVNHQGVICLLEAVKKIPETKRPIIVLACSVLQMDIQMPGIIGIDQPLKDTTEPYILSKNKMFYDSLPYLKDGLDIRFAFIANTTGEGHPLGYFPTDIANQLIQSEKIIHGPVDHKRPFLHGKDAANMFFYGLTKLSSGDRFLVAGKQSTKLEDFMRTMMEVAEKTDVETYQDPKFGNPSPIKDINFDISQLESLGYRQAFNIPDICRTLLLDRARVLRGEPLPQRRIVGY